jgi:protein TonB
MVKQSVVPQVPQPTTSALPKPSPMTLATTQPTRQPTTQSTTTTTEEVPPPQPTTTTEEAPPPQVQSEMMNNQLAAPARIPHNIKMVAEKEAPPSSGFGVAGMEGLSGSGSGAIGSVFNGQGRPKVKAEPPKIVNISAGVAVGLLIQKTTPLYPSIAKTARVAGTVVLQATISKTGSIQNLHVVSGPEMLRGAAMDAVRTWRYKPYKLNNEPVDVDTTVNVVFALGG